jgi:hypothetical protein
LPAVIAVCLLGLHHAVCGTAARFRLALAAGVLLLAVMVRTLDAAVCERFALGTHFLWHVLVAAVIYLCASTLLAVQRSGVQHRA